jgi:preprotein translocase subunit YajC
MDTFILIILIVAFLVVLFMRNEPTKKEKKEIEKIS